MKIEELLIYECPSIAEYISFNWVQNIVAKYLSYKINRKLNRYNNRIERSEMLKPFIK